MLSGRRLSGVNPVGNGVLHSKQFSSVDSAGNGLRVDFGFNRKLLVTLDGFRRRYPGLNTQSEELQLGWVALPLATNIAGSAVYTLSYDIYPIP